MTLKFAFVEKLLKSKKSGTRVSGFQKMKKKSKSGVFFYSNYAGMNHILAMSFEKVKTHYFCPFLITVSLGRRTSASQNR